MWYVYLLYSSKIKRTYIGATTDVARRLRQHNGEIKGGARSTSLGSGTWQVVGYIGPFHTKSECYRWEKIIKLRARGLEAREKTMRMVALGCCPEGKFYQPPTGLEWKEFEDVKEVAKRSKKAGRVKGKKGIRKV